MNAMLDTLVVGLSDAVKQSIEDTIREDERAKVIEEVRCRALDMGDSYDITHRALDAIERGDYRKPQEGVE